MRHLPYSCAVMLAMLTSSLVAQTWSQAATTGAPLARSNHAMAYDPSRGYTVLFGGRTSSSPLADTWVWNGIAWTQMSPGASPTARYDHHMAYDPSRNAIVLFGGRSGSGSSQYLGDTWMWNGLNWVPIVSAVSPSPRSEHTMAYHAGLASVVLYGGAGNPTPTNHTWQLTASGWLQMSLAANPPSVGRATMAANSFNGRVVLFVSTTSSSNKFWELTGATWNQLPAPPIWVTQCTMTPTADGHVIAAVDSTTVSAATLLMYKWSGSQWELRGSTPGPTTPLGSFNRDVRFAYDSTRGRSVLFSGLWGAADTWEYADSLFPASTSAYGVGCGSPLLTLGPAVGSRPLLGTNFTVDLVGVPVGFSWIALGLSDGASGALPLPLPLDGFGFVGCNLYHDAIVIGLGCTPTGTTSASWTWQIPTPLSNLGFTAFIQGYALAPGQPGAITFSNGLRMTMGNF